MPSIPRIPRFGSSRRVGGEIASLANRCAGEDIDFTPTTDLPPGSGSLFTFSRGPSQGQTYIEFVSGVFNVVVMDLQTPPVLHAQFLRIPPVTVDCLRFTAESMIDLVAKIDVYTGHVDKINHAKKVIARTNQHLKAAGQKNVVSGS